MGIFSRLFGRKPSQRVQTPGQRGTGGGGLEAGEVEDFVYGEQLLFVQSSNVAAAQYFIRTGQLMVEFLSGSAYLYDDVSEGESIGFAKAPSKGKWIAVNLKGLGFPLEKHLKPYRQIK